jgi:hypothetical protein
MKRVKCIGCDNKVNSPYTVCKVCAYKDEVRRSLGIGISADYQLGNDPVVNGLCFLHACGVLNTFLEKTYSATSAFIDSTKPLNLVDEYCIDDLVLSTYDELSYGRVDLKLFTRFGWKDK